MSIIATFGRVNYDGTDIADIFHNIKSYWENIKGNFQLENYSIQGSPRPEQLAYTLYGDPNLYWVLLLINDVINPWDEWIKSDEHVSEYVVNKYANIDADPYKIHHHENEDGDMFFGLVEYDDEPGVWYDKGDINKLYPQYVGTLIPITRIEHELSENEEKRAIKIIRESDIPKFIDLMDGQIERVLRNGQNN